MKALISEIVYVLKSLDKATHIKLTVMVIVTVLVSILFFTTIENPVVEKWKDNKETEQVFEQREQQEELGDKDPVY